MAASHVRSVLVREPACLSRAACETYCGAERPSIDEESSGHLAKVHRS